MFYSQVILAKKGPLAKVWLAAHWGDKKLARPQIFATDIAQSVDTIVNPTMPLALRMSGHLLLGVVRIYSRKVKYVLSDCTEAMLKLQMAFANGTTQSSTTKGKELLDGSNGGSGGTSGGGGMNNASHVTNFGDYEQVHVVEGFCLPLPDQSEWIVADDDDNEEVDDVMAALHGEQQGGGLPGRVVGVGASLQSPQARYQPPTEETWVPFDPENEDEDEEDNDEDVHHNQSRVSDVEIARAAGDSFLSGDEVCGTTTTTATLVAAITLSHSLSHTHPLALFIPQTRRGSSIIEKSPAFMNTGPEEEEQEEDEPMDFAHVAFPDDDDEEEEEEDQKQHATMTKTNTKNDSSLLRLSMEDGTPDISGLASPPGLDESHQDDDNERNQEDGQPRTNATHKRTAPDNNNNKDPKPPKRRKRRKVIIDNDHIELSNEHIKAMLADTSDLVRRMRHPSDHAMLDDDEDFDIDKTTRTAAAFVPILTQPFLADDGHLHSDLLELWHNNFYRALDRPCPFELRRRQETPDDVEHARRGVEEEDDNDDEEISQSSSNGKANRPSVFNNLLQEEEEDNEEPDDFAPPPMDDDDEEEDPLNPTMDSEEDDDDEEEVDTLLHGSIEDLGLVNELHLAEEEEEDEEEREAVGEHGGTKWHKHTVTVLKLLQNHIRPEGAEEDGAETTTAKPTSLDFAELAKNVNRRTAASCFIECLVRGARRGGSVKQLCVFERCVCILCLTLWLRHAPFLAAIENLGLCRVDTRRRVWTNCHFCGTSVPRSSTE